MAIPWRKALYNDLEVTREFQDGWWQDEIGKWIGMEQKWYQDTGGQAGAVAEDEMSVGEQGTKMRERWCVWDTFRWWKLP